jgi:hypothetical protein
MPECRQQPTDRCQYSILGPVMMVVSAAGLGNLPAQVLVQTLEKTGALP